MAKDVRLEGFPLLVRFDRGNFDFSATRPDGSDLGFTTASGEPLAHEIEQWDATSGSAAVWVRVPVIQGHEEQELRVRWGGAARPADGTRVFDASNGFAAVWHLEGGGRDAVTGATARDSGTAPAPGRVGGARRFAEGKGLAAADTAGLPTGRMANSTEAWIRPTRVNGTIAGWGHEKLRSKVVLQFRSPPHVQVDAYFSAANARGRTRIAPGEWAHVVHTYEDGRARLYVNGVLDSESDRRADVLDVDAAPRAWIGGWYGNFDFEGDLDEVRISRVSRPPEWVRLSFENQRPEQRLVGHAIPGTTEFGIRAREVELTEGRDATVSADAGGARKVVWILRRGGEEAVVATDRLECRLEAGRFAGMQSGELEFRAVFAGGARTARVPVRFVEAIADPNVTIAGPRSWDGTRPIRLEARMAGGGGARRQGLETRYTWKLDGPGTIHTVRGGALELAGALQKGELVVTLTTENGGTPVTNVHRIRVKAPMRREAVPRPEEAVELPEDNRFYARDARNKATVVCRGRVTEPVDRVFVRMQGEDGSRQEMSTTPLGNGTYRLEVSIRAGLFRHTIEVGSVVRGEERIFRRATNVVCGDVFLIMGQSNAVATDWGREEVDFRSPWIRTHGGTGGGHGGRTGWAEATYRSRDGAHEVGYWGMEVARHLVDTQKVPVCIVNGAVGGTRIDQHQRNASDPADNRTLYGRLLGRVRAAGLTHGVRGIFWHQGENDQGADGPTGGFGWEGYRDYFIQLVAGWRMDYPNAAHVHVFQIWPKACAMGVDGSDNVLREVQRRLPSAVTDLTVLATLGIEPPGGCHYPAEGYAAMARLVIPVVEKVHYGKRWDRPVTSPDLGRARFGKGTRRVVELEFDQPVVWRPELATEFSFGEPGVSVVGGAVAGNVLRLELSREPGAGRCRVSYLDSARWSSKRVLRGENGLAALTFWGVEVEAGE